jgi:hypothetical protein
MGVNKDSSAFKGWPIREVKSHLISEGYVQTSHVSSYKYWVDCVGGGRDIEYYVSEVRYATKKYSKRNVHRPFSIIRYDGTVDHQVEDVYKAVEFARQRSL